MRFLSKLQCGFRRDGGILLQKGVNEFPEPLTEQERAFIDAMLKAKLVEEIMEPASEEAPVSTTTPMSTRVDMAPKKAMRVRRGVGK
jgi:hypothetical protein